MLLLAVGVLSTVGYVVGGAPPGSVVAVLPGALVALFYVLLGVGSTIGLTGCLLRRFELGAGLEQGGMLIQAAGLLLYLVSVAAYAPGRGWGQLLILGAWVVADLARAVEIWADLRALRRAGRP
jgi:hypothetical protein